MSSQLYLDCFDRVMGKIAGATPAGVTDEHRTECLKDIRNTLKKRIPTPERRALRMLQGDLQLEPQHGIRTYVPSRYAVGAAQSSHGIHVLGGTRSVELSDHQPFPVPTVAQAKAFGALLKRPASRPNRKRQQDSITSDGARPRSSNGEARLTPKKLRSPDDLSHVP